MHEFGYIVIGMMIVFYAVAWLSRFRSQPTDIVVKTWESP